MATNRRWTGQDGSQREEACFVDCRMFGKRAEVINKYCKRGNPLFVEGRLTFDSWEAQDGSKRSKLRVTVENFEFISSGGGGGAGQTRQNTGGMNSDQPQQANEDDIPF